MGKEFSTMNAQPTLGIQTTSIYWPVRANQPTKPVFLFRLDFWDVGHTSSARFDYIDKVLIFIYFARNLSIKYFLSDLGCG